MFDPAAVTCPILRTVLVESQLFLTREGPTDLLERMALLPICAPADYVEHVDRATSFLDWAIRSALPWTLLKKAEILRRVAGDVRSTPRFNEGSPLAQLDDTLTAAQTIVRAQTGWRSYDQLRAVDDALGAAGDALASLMEARRIDVPSLRTRGRDLLKSGRRAQVKVELDRALCCATSILVASGSSWLFRSMAVMFGEMAGEAVPSHGAALGPLVNPHGDPRVDLLTRWCVECRAAISAESRRVRCVHCLTPWEAPPPSLAGEERCPIAIGV